MDAKSQGGRDCCAGASRGARARLSTTRCGRPTTCRRIGWRKRKCDGPTLSYVDTLVKVGSENNETTVRRRSMLFAGFIARTVEERLPQRGMFGAAVCRGQELHRATGGVHGVSKERFAGVRHQNRRTARSSTGGR